MPAGPTRLGVSAAAAVFALDQATKIAAASWLDRGGDAVAVTPFFNLVLVHNRGVSFGLFASAPGWGRWALAALAFAVAAGLAVWLSRAAERPLALALGLLIGGASGNLADRLYLGAVVDFLDFHAAGFHWPAFNLADAAICVGAALLAWTGLIGPRAASRLRGGVGGKG